MPIDISANKHLIPDKYFKPGNYEDDPQTTVKHREFTERVPLDYAFCRWLAIEKGLTLLPVSAFCLQESQKLTENYVRLAICKTP